MNSKSSFRFLLLLAVSAVASCQGFTKEEKTTGIAANVAHTALTDAEKYTVLDKKESFVNWRGSMLGGVNSHTGFVYVSKGEIWVDNGAVVGGKVDIDMTTIEDHQHGTDNNLVNHLKDTDFFDVTKFPVSSMVIGKVSPLGSGKHTVSGDLTIKGITHPVSFPAEIALNNGNLHANGRLVIDRTQWNVRYKSAKFYALVADQTMSDSIELHIQILARK
ncbi:MAG: hypothetical protein DI538_29870 [Azospira oryzae]|nr:MAG: hypothetical protein DI538_29870 [Azospira oryzae]